MPPPHSRPRAPPPARVPGPAGAPASRRMVEVAALAALYVATGRLGLALDAVSGFAALVWIPAGLSVAAVVLVGYRMAAGVALGAFALNLLVGAPAAVAAGIAGGNTLEAVAAAYLLRRIPGFRPSLDRVRDALGLILLAGGLCSALGASVGVTSLLVGRVVPPEGYIVTWTAWWLGDAIGILVVAPLLLTWGAEGARPKAVSGSETLALAAALLATSGFVFLREPLTQPGAFLQPYLLFGPLLWATLRFETRGAASGVFFVSAVAVTGTVLSRGPFDTGPLLERLWTLQGFMGLVAVTFLLLAALASEHRQTERALIRALEAAQSSSGAKSRFLAVMSHELRTPLTSIVGYADLLEEEIVGPLTPEQKRHLSRIRVAAWHLVSIIDGILTFSRAEAGRERAAIQVVDAGALLREVATLLEPQAAAKGLALEASTPEEPLELHTDPGKLRQILLNLVGNAVKFSDRGRIELEARRGTGSVVFRVRDQGPGIPSERLRTIFEPFSQIQEDPNAVSTGAGLGLTVASMLAELLGGAVEVESEVGEGSTFTLRLPMEALPLVAAEQGVVPAAPWSGNRGHR